MIQILRINPGNPAIRRFAAIIAVRINRPRRALDHADVVADGAITPFAALKPGHAGPSRFTRR